MIEPRKQISSILGDLYRLLGDQSLLRFELYGDPTPLMRPRIRGRSCYDGQSQLKLIKGIGLRNQNDERPTHEHGLFMGVIFFMPIPVSWSLRKKEKMLNAYHVCKPDFSNLLKFVEDLSVDCRILRDDSLIAGVLGFKVYSETPRTEFIFIELQDTIN